VAVERIVSSVLTLDQAATWKQLAGKPFNNDKVWQPSFFGPGGFGRGFGGPPGGPGGPGGGRGGERMDRGGRRPDERREGPGAATEPATKS
jgi:hypothetical protein